MLYPDFPRRLEAYKVTLELITSCQPACDQLKRSDALAERICAMAYRLRQRCC